MNKKIQAVTVSKNYLDKLKWSIKYLQIAERKNGLKYWRVYCTGETGFDKIALQGNAFQYAHVHDVPYVHNIRQGDYIDDAQKRLLRKHKVKGV